MALSRRRQTNEMIFSLRCRTNRWTRAEPASLSSTTCPLRSCLPPRQLRRWVTSLPYNKALTGMEAFLTHDAGNWLEAFSDSAWETVSEYRSALGVFGIFFWGPVFGIRERHEGIRLLPY